MLDYQEYISSKFWQEKSKTLREEISKCEICGSNVNLHTHHKTYERLGEELPEDLQVLCAKCHKESHIKLEAIAEVEGRKHILLFSKEDYVIHASPWKSYGLGQVKQADSEEVCVKFQRKEAVFKLNSIKYLTKTSKDELLTPLNVPDKLSIFFKNRERDNKAVFGNILINDLFNTERFIVEPCLGIGAEKKPPTLKNLSGYTTFYFVSHLLREVVSKNQIGMFDIFLGNTGTMTFEQSKDYCQVNKPCRKNYTSNGIKCLRDPSIDKLVYYRDKFICQFCQMPLKSKINNIIPIDNNYNFGSVSNYLSVCTKCRSVYKNDFFKFVSDLRDYRVFTDSRLWDKFVLECLQKEIQEFKNIGYLNLFDRN